MCERGISLVVVFSFCYLSCFNHCSVHYTMEAPRIFSRTDDSSLQDVRRVSFSRPAVRQRHRETSVPRQLGSGSGFPAVSQQTPTNGVSNQPICGGGWILSGRRFCGRESSARTAGHGHGRRRVRGRAFDAEALPGVHSEDAVDLDDGLPDEFLLLELTGLLLLVLHGLCCWDGVWGRPISEYSANYSWQAWQFLLKTLRAPLGGHTGQSLWSLYQAWLLYRLAFIAGVPAQRSK